MNMNYLPKYLKLKENIKELITTGQIKPEEKLPTENDLCEEYNISRHTVRKALNILEQEGFVYKKQGIGTFCTKSIKQPTYNIGFISISLHDYIFSDILSGVDSILHENGYQIILGNSKDDQQREKEILNEFLKKEIDGLIIEPAKSAYNYSNIGLLERFVDNDIPVVVLDSNLENEKFNHVIVDDQKGAYLATEFFINKGHQQIAIIYKGLHMPSINRFQGYEEALKDNNIPVYNDYIKKYYISEFEDQDKFKEEIKEITIELMRLDNPPTAIFCFNDQVAILVKELLGDLNYRVPEDVSIIGFDDSSLVELKNISITSIAHPKMRSGQKAAKLILENINKRNNDLNENIIFNPRLIERSSVKDLS